MRLLILSDIHANDVALDSLFYQIKQSKHLHYDKMICLGDIIGYYQSPLSVWETVKKHCGSEWILPGNHDVSAIRWDEAHRFSLSTQAIFALAAHRKLLQREEAVWNDFLQTCQNKELQLPRRETRTTYNNFEITYVHGSPEEDADQSSVIAPYLSPFPNPQHNPIGHAFSKFRNHETPKLIFFGHTHVPTFMITLKGDVLPNHIYIPIHQYTTPENDCPFHLHTDLTPFLPEGVTYDQIGAIAINGGSVGQPRDGVGSIDDKNRAHAVLLDTEAQTIRFIVVEYVISGIQNGLWNLSGWEDMTLDEANHFQSLIRNDEKLITDGLFNNIMSELGQKWADVDTFKQFVLYQKVTNEHLDVYKQTIQLIWRYKYMPDLMNILKKPDNDRRDHKYAYRYSQQGFFITR